LNHLRPVWTQLARDLRAVFSDEPFDLGLREWPLVHEDIIGEHPVRVDIDREAIRMSRNNFRGDELRIAALDWIDEMNPMIFDMD
jgi:hypothetical protein